MGDPIRPIQAEEFHPVPPPQNPANPVKKTQPLTPVTPVNEHPNFAGRKQAYQTASVSAAALSHDRADCSIQFKTILYPIDSDEFSKLHVQDALSYAKTFQAQLHLIHVADSDDKQIALWAQQKELETFLKEKAFTGMSCSVIIEQGDVAEMICETADVIKADLIIMPTHGRSGLNHLLLGSITEEVIRTAPCPVLVLR